MTITLYVNWEAQELYKNEKELVEGYLDFHGGATAHFNDFLCESYEADTLFYATEEKKKNILKEYNTIVLENAKDWAKISNMEQKIEI